MTENSLLKGNVIIFGAGGQLGSELRKLLPDSIGVFHSAEPGEISLDISNYVAVEDFILKKRPQVIINTVALTNVDACERERQRALDINAKAVRHIVRASSVTESYVIHVSTDYVFNGKDGMYKESSTPNPINYYGLSKLLGDWAALSYDDSLVVRTSGVFGYKSNYPRFVLTQLNSGKEIKAVKSFYSPIHARLLANAIFELMELRRTGIINVAGPRISRYNLAIAIANRINAPTKDIIELDQSEMTWAAQRPYDSSLDCTLSRRLVTDSFYDLDKNLDLLVHG